MLGQKYVRISPDAHAQRLGYQEGFQNVSLLISRLEQVVSSKQAGRCRQCPA